MTYDIFSVYVEVVSQAEIDTLGNRVLVKNLPVWSRHFQLWQFLKKNNCFGFNDEFRAFMVHYTTSVRKKEVTLTEFLELLENHKP